MMKPHPIGSIKTACRSCGCDVYGIYESVQFIPTKKPLPEKRFAELRLTPTEDCHSTVYITCDYGHTHRYYCKIVEI